MEDIDLLTMEVPVVVTATRREQTTTSLPYAVSVITAEDIRRSGARSVPDALRLAPGMDVADIHFGNAAVSPRGRAAFITRDVLVLVDGRQIYDSVYGGTMWGGWAFQLEDIERIEVIRGPGGVTWGANAVNGVINIITKDPGEQLGLTATGGGGSRGTNKEHLGYAFADGRLRLRVSGEHESSDGFNEGGSILRKLDDSYRGGRTGVHAIFDVSPEDTLTLSAGNSLVENGYPPGIFAGLRLEQAGTQAEYVTTKWSHKIAADNVLELTAYFNDFGSRTGMPATEYRYQQYALQLSHTFKPAEDHTITWGIDNRTDTVDASNADPFLLSKDFVSTDIIGLYLQDEWRFAPRWTLSLGGRIDYEFYGGFQPSARAALSYELAKDSLLYGAVSRAFQMFPAALRFADVPLLEGLARFQADRDVDPETLMAYEVGYRGRFFGRLETSLNLFWHEYDDLTALSFDVGPPGLFKTTLGNGAGAAIHGLEWENKYRATDRLTLLANYTYEVMDWKGPAPFLLTDCTWLPKHKFMVGARYNVTDNLNLSSHLYYVDATKSPDPSGFFPMRRLDPYFRLDLRGEYEFWKKQASVAVGVRNLCDPQHREGATLFFNDAEVPRMVYAEFRMTFK